VTHAALYPYLTAFFITNNTLGPGDKVITKYAIKNNNQVSKFKCNHLNVSKYNARLNCQQSWLVFWNKRRDSFDGQVAGSCYMLILNKAIYSNHFKICYTTS